MLPVSPIPVELWNQIPPTAQAAVLALGQKYERRLQALQQQVAQLTERLNQNSTNSSQPPSSDPPHLKRRPPKESSGRQQGGKPGHARRQRPLVPPERVQQIIPLKPSACRRCGHALYGEDAQPRRHQVAEIPPLQPEVTEYRLHRLSCSSCGTRTCASLPAGVPAGAFGPRLQAVLAILAGGYRLGKRPIRQLAHDLFGLSISTGMVVKLERSTAEALQEPMAELEEYLRTQHANVDETSWREAGQKAWLWVVVTPLVTVFHIAATRCGKVAGQLLGSAYRQVVTSDRWKAYNGCRRRQFCSGLRAHAREALTRGGAEFERRAGDRVSRVIGPALGAPGIDMANTLKDMPPLLHDARLSDCRWDGHLNTLHLCFRCLRRNVDRTPVEDCTVDLKLGGVERIVAYYSPASVTVKPSEFEPDSRITLADLEDWRRGAVEAHLAINSPQAKFEAATACVREALVGGPEDRPIESPLRVHVSFEPHSYGPHPR
jgi:transposase